MLKTELVVKAVGSPDFNSLSDFERTAFFETLFDKITELYKQKGIENADNLSGNKLKKMLIELMGL